MSKRSKPSVRYRGISVPEPLIDQIKKHIAKKQEYRSVADFVTQAIREKMEFRRAAVGALDRAIDEMKKRGHYFTMRRVGNDILIGDEVFRLVKNKEKKINRMQTTKRKENEKI